jgi:transglutaminase-like putative cysteine protease
VTDPGGVAGPLIQVRAEANGSANGPASAVMLVRGAFWPDQWMVEDALTIAGAEVEEGPVAPGGERPVRARSAGGPVRLDYRGTFRVAGAGRLVTDPEAELPTPDRVIFPLLEWTLPSRYCPSDLIAPTADALFGARPRVAGLLTEVVGWVRDHVTYRPGVSDALTGADETLLRREGVCRDLAHVAVSLLRGLAVPARVVSGYALDLDPPDFHALVEAHDGRAWRLLDATGRAPVETVVRIGAGRDAADVAWSTATGPLLFEDLQISVSRVEDAAV